MPVTYPIQPPCERSSAPDPAGLPTVHVQLASLTGYEALIGVAGEAA